MAGSPSKWPCAWIGGPRPPVQGEAGPNSACGWAAPSPSTHIPSHTPLPPPSLTQVLQRRYGKEADIWSCGVILYILLCGYPPFHGDSTQQIFKHIISQPLDLKSDPWPRISEGAKVRRGTRREPLEQGRVGGVDGEGGKGLSAGDTGSEGT